MLFQCWASVEDGGPTLKQHWVNPPCLHLYYKLHGKRPQLYLLIPLLFHRISRQTWHIKPMLVHRLQPRPNNKTVLFPLLVFAVIRGGDVFSQHNPTAYVPWRSIGIWIWHHVLNLVLEFCWLVVSCASQTTSIRQQFNTGPAAQTLARCWAVVGCLQLGLAVVKCWKDVCHLA